MSIQDFHSGQFSRKCFITIPRSPASKKTLFLSASLESEHSLIVEQLCLAVLREGSATAGHIHKYSTSGEAGYFASAPASAGAFFRALKKLEDGEFVWSKIENKPNYKSDRSGARVYTITASGRQKFEKDLFDDLGKDVFKNEFLLFARFVEFLPAQLVAERVDERLVEIDRRIVKFEDQQMKTEFGAQSWVLKHAIRCLRLTRSDIEEHKFDLIGMARTDANASTLTK